MSTDNNQLPPLPEPEGEILDITEHGRPYRKAAGLFTDDQMHAYARAALAQRQGEPVWSEYVAGMIVAYLGGGVDDPRIKPIAGIISRRLVHLAPATAEQPRILTDELIDKVALDTLGFEKDDLQPVNRSDLHRFASAILAATAPAPVAPLEAELTTGYVQRVPDHCDRITWRNRYYQLPLDGAAPAPVAPTMDDALAAGDGTLHGAIDYWRARALAAGAGAPVAPTVEQRDDAGVIDQRWYIQRPSNLTNAPTTPWLYEHADGHHLVTYPGAAILAGDPQWVRVGPVEVQGVGALLHEALSYATYALTADPYWTKDPLVSDAVDKARAALASTKKETPPAPATPNIEAAAKMLAERMDYPWEHMPALGRKNMCEHATEVLRAAGIASTKKDAT